MKIAQNGEVYIRLLTIQDTDNIIKWRNSPFVKSKFIYREPLTVEMQEDWIRTHINEGKVIQFIIGSGESEVGSVYFQNIDEKCISAEYGIFMDEAASGKGIGYKASMLAIDYMFKEFGLKYINLRFLDGNDNARHMYEKCGFKLENRTETVVIDDKEVTIRFMILYQEDFVNK